MPPDPNQDQIKYSRIKSFDEIKRVAILTINNKKFYVNQESNRILALQEFGTSITTQKKAKFRIIESSKNISSLDETHPLSNLVKLGEDIFPLMEVDYEGKIYYFSPFKFGEKYFFTNLTDQLAGGEDSLELFNQKFEGTNKYVIPGNFWLRSTRAPKTTSSSGHPEIFNKVLVEAFKDQTTGKKIFYLDARIGNDIDGGGHHLAIKLDFTKDNSIKVSFKNSTRVPKEYLEQINDSIKKELVAPFCEALGKDYPGDDQIEIEALKGYGQLFSNGCPEATLQNILFFDEDHEKLEFESVDLKESENEALTQDEIEQFKATPNLRAIVKTPTLKDALKLRSAYEMGPTFSQLGLPIEDFLADLTSNHNNLDSPRSDIESSNSLLESMMSYYEDDIDRMLNDGNEKTENDITNRVVEFTESDINLKGVSLNISKDLNFVAIISPPSMTFNKNSEVKIIDGENNDSGRTEKNVSSDIFLFILEELKTKLEPNKQEEIFKEVFGYSMNENNIKTIFDSDLTPEKIFKIIGLMPNITPIIIRNENNTFYLINLSYLQEKWATQIAKKEAAKIPAIPADPEIPAHSSKPPAEETTDNARSVPPSKLLITEFLNTKPAEEGKIAKLQSTPQIIALEEIIESQKSELYPQAPYVGCGFRCDILEDPETKIISIKPTEVFPGNKRFFTTEADGTKSYLANQNAIIGKSIIAVKINGVETTISEIFNGQSKTEAYKKLASIFHSQGDIELIASDGSRISCERNHSSIFVTKESRDEKVQEFFKDKFDGSGYGYNPNFHGVSVVTDKPVSIPNNLTTNPPIPLITPPAPTTILPVPPTILPTFPPLPPLPPLPPEKKKKPTLPSSNENKKDKKDKKDSDDSTSSSIFEALETLAKKISKEATKLKTSKGGRSDNRKLNNVEQDGERLEKLSQFCQASKKNNQEDYLDGGFSEPEFARNVTKDTSIVSLRKKDKKDGELSPENTYALSHAKEGAYGRRKSLEHANKILFENLSDKEIESMKKAPMKDYWSKLESLRKTIKDNKIQSFKSYKEIEEVMCGKKIFEDDESNRDLNNFLDGDFTKDLDYYLFGTSKGGVLSMSEVTVDTELNHLGINSLYTETTANRFGRFVFIPPATGFHEPGIMFCTQVDPETGETTFEQNIITSDSAHTNNSGHKYQREIGNAINYGFSGDNVQLNMIESPAIKVIHDGNCNVWTDCAYVAIINYIKQHNLNDDDQEKFYNDLKNGSITKYEFQKYYPGYLESQDTGVPDANGNNPGFDIFRARFITKFCNIMSSQHTPLNDETAVRNYLTASMFIEDEELGKNCGYTINELEKIKNNSASVIKNTPHERIAQIAKELGLESTNLPSSTFQNPSSNNMNKRNTDKQL